MGTRDMMSQSNHPISEQPNITEQPRRSDNSHDRTREEPPCVFTSITYRIAAGKDKVWFYVHEDILIEAGGKLADWTPAQYDSTRIDLPCLDPAVFELVLEYLYGRCYKTYSSNVNPRHADSSDAALDLARSCKLYLFAKEFNMPQLRSDMQHDIQTLWIDDYEGVLDAAKLVYNRERVTVAPWFRDFVIGHTKRALVDTQVATLPWFLDVFSGNYGKLGVVIFEVFRDKYNQHLRKPTIKMDTGAASAGEACGTELIVDDSTPINQVSLEGSKTEQRKAIKVLDKSMPPKTDSCVTKPQSGVIEDRQTQQVEQVSGTRISKNAQRPTTPYSEKTLQESESESSSEADPSGIDTETTTRLSGAQELESLAEWTLSESGRESTISTEPGSALSSLLNDAEDLTVMMALEIYHQGNAHRFLRRKLIVGWASFVNEILLCMPQCVNALPGVERYWLHDLRVRHEGEFFSVRIDAREAFLHMLKNSSRKSETVNISMVLYASERPYDTEDFLIPCSLETDDDLECD